MNRSIARGHGAAAAPLDELHDGLPLKDGLAALVGRLRPEHELAPLGARLGKRERGRDRVPDPHGRDQLIFSAAQVVEAALVSVRGV